MKTLVKKDIHLMKINNIALIIAGTLLGYLIGLNSGIGVSKNMYLWVGIILICIPLSILTIEDNKTKDIILKSLPIDREDIVTSRYITMFIYIISVFGIIFISSYIFFYSHDIISLGKPIPLISLLFNIIMAVIFISVTLPFQYLNRGVSQILNIILYISLIIVPTIIRRNNTNLSDIGLLKYIDHISYINPFLFTILGVILYLISLQISKKIYRLVDK